jgi:hypothetical protein
VFFKRIRKIVELIGNVGFHSNSWLMLYIRFTTWFQSVSALILMTTRRILVPQMPAHIVVKMDHAKTQCHPSDEQFRANTYIYWVRSYFDSRKFDWHHLLTFVKCKFLRINLNSQFIN